MTQSRAERGAARRRTRHKLFGVAAAIALVIAAVAAVALYAQSTKEPERVVASADEAVLPYTESVASTSASTSASSTALASAKAVPLVEVPNLIGRLGSEAVSLLAAAGLKPSTTVDAAARIADQDPDAGSVVASGTVVSLTVVAAQPATAKPKTASKAVVVCIDPGHQEHSDTKKEPVGPGSSDMKARVAGGATGVATGIPEYEIALQIAMNLKHRLEADGIKVVMTRTTNDVSMSNAERAQIANSAKAALFVRIHANGSPDSRAAGVSTLYPGSTPWTNKIEERSKRAAGIVQRAVLTTTGAPNDGVTLRSDLAGFNWATVPSVLVECGYLSNPVEDRLLSSPQYQDKVAIGIAAGVQRYLGR